MRLPAGQERIPAHFRVLPRPEKEVFQTQQLAEAAQGRSGHGTRPPVAQTGRTLRQRASDSTGHGSEGRSSPAPPPLHFQPRNHPSTTTATTAAAAPPPTTTTTTAAAAAAAAVAGATTTLK